MRNYYELWIYRKIVDAVSYRLKQIDIICNHSVIEIFTTKTYNN